MITTTGMAGVLPAACLNNTINNRGSLAVAKSVIYFFVQTNRQSLCDFEINNRIDDSELFLS